jgi:hypothetical protein
LLANNDGRCGSGVDASRKHKITGCEGGRIIALREAWRDAGKRYSNKAAELIFFLEHEFNKWSLNLIRVDF